MGLIIYRKADNKVAAEYLQYPLHDKELFSKFLSIGGYNEADYGIIDVPPEMVLVGATKKLIIKDGMLEVGGNRPHLVDETILPSEAEEMREKDLVLQLALAEAVEKQEMDKVTNQLAIAELVEKQELDKLNNQLALAEVVESLTIKGVL